MKTPLGTLVCVVVIFAALPAHAATYTVSSLADSGAGTLRQAISDANGNVGADSIAFQPGLSGTITLTTGTLAVTDSVVVQGPGATFVTVNGNGSRVFTIGDGTGTVLTVAINGLTLTSSATVGANGGAISNDQESVSLDGVEIRGITTTGEGGGIWSFLGSMTITNSTIAENHANKSGAILDIGTGLTMRNSTVAGNSASDSKGAIHQQYGGATITNSTIANNSATYVGGIQCESATITFESVLMNNNTDGTGANDIDRIGGNSYVNATTSLFQENVTVGGGPTDVINGTAVNNIFGASAGLTALANNGGQTRTLLPGPGSLAIDHGSNPAGLATDQRGAGFPRVAGAAIDIGAVEFGSQGGSIPSLSGVGLATLMILLAAAALVALRRVA